MNEQNERWFNSTNWKLIFCPSKFQVVAYEQNIKQSIIQKLKIKFDHMNVFKKKVLEITFQIWIKRVELGIQWWIKKNTRLVATKK